MDETAASALADLRLCFSTASDLYLRYVRSVDLGESAAAIEDLAGTREYDAHRLGETALAEGTALPDPGLEAEVARDELSFGRTPPSTQAQVLYRVQRSENQLAHLTDHLMSVFSPGRVRDILGATLDGIRTLQPTLRDMRRALTDASRSYDALPSPGAAPVSVLAAEGEEFTVWFGTNRDRDRRGWSRRAGDTVYYGRCRVIVPKGHSLGSLGPTVTSWGAKPLRLSATEILPQAQFWADLRGTCASLQAGARQALVFLHGYRTDFHRAALRTAQLKADLQHQGPAAFFAWPSADQFLGYASDKAAIEASEAFIRDFLVDFALRSGAAAVHIIAHSMGNIGLLRAMDTIARDAATRSGVRFGQIVLAAPDVDTRLFRNLAHAYGQLAARTTLYVAENDIALGGSRWMHGDYPRAGLAPPFVVVPGVDTINVSRINSDILGFRHGYAAGLDKVLSDIHALLSHGAPPSRRFRLRAAGSPDEIYWEFMP